MDGQERVVRVCVGEAQAGNGCALGAWVMRCGGTTVVVAVQWGKKICNVQD